MEPEKDRPYEPLCPTCKSPVSDEATHCEICGGYFPAARHRAGNPVGGALCGIVRGLGMISFVAAGMGVFRLIVPPFQLDELILAGGGAGAFAFFLWLASRLHASTYHVQ